MERPKQAHNRAPAGRGGSAPLTDAQAKTILLLAALGLAVLAIVAVLLLKSLPPSPAQPVVLSDRPVENTLAPAAVPETPALRQLLPAGCAQIPGALTEAQNAVVTGDHALDVMLGQDAASVVLAGLAPAAGGAEGLAGLIDGQPVVLVQDQSAPDPQGRLPVYAYANGWFLNQEMIRRGLARADVAVSGQACAAVFQEAESQAQAQRVGMWEPTPVPTATFVPTVGLDPALQPPCDCMRRPVCSDFSTHDEAQACYNACNDYNSRLDDDRDGLACEGLP